MILPFILKRALPALALLSLQGCLPPQADYELGFGTTEVVGTVRMADADSGVSAPLIITLKNHYKFIPVQQRDDLLPAREFDPAKSITHPTAHLQWVGPSGRFVIHMPADVVSMDIMFVAADHLTETFRFSRSLGMGRITYRALLRPMPGWRDHFYTFLEPQLQHLIVEERYRLSDSHQKQLGDWLEMQKNRIEAGRASSRGAGGEDPPSRAN